MRNALLFLAASLVGAWAFGQPAEQAVSLSFPVSVVDASGGPVRGLTAANFVLYDEKRKQAITSCDVVDFASDAAAGALTPTNPAARRSFVLLFDLGNTSAHSMSRAQDAARRFLAEIAGPRDLVAVATVHPDHGFRFVTAFTTDRHLIVSAVSNPAAFRSSDPLRLGSAPAGEMPVAPVSDPPMAADANESQMRQRIEREIDSLGNLAHALRMMPGRKQVIFLSEGFDTHLLQSAGAQNAKEQIVDRMADSFRVSDVVLHAVDVRGSDASAGGTGPSLFLLARPTGGEVFQSANDPHGDFARLLHRQEVVYVLGFHLSDFSPGSFHNVSVRLVNSLVNAPDNARVLQAAGYFERGRATPVERSLTNAQIIVNDLPQRDLRLNLLAVPFPPASAGRPAQVPVVIDINGSDLLRETSTTIGGADIFVYAFDSNGVVRDRLYDCLTVEVAKAGEKVRRTGIRYYGTLMLPPGRYAVKALVRTGDTDRGAVEATEKRGYERVNITVPAEGQTAILPPIPIDEDGKWLTVHGLRRADGDYPFEYAGRTFYPTATIDTTSGPRKAAVFIFGARQADLTFETRPRTRVLGVTEGNGVTKVVLQIDKAAGASALDVTVFKKGIAGGQRTSVPLM